MDMQVPHALLQVPEKYRLYHTGERPEFFFSSQLCAHFEPGQHAIWLRWRPRPRPNFNPELLRDLAAYCAFVTGTNGAVQCYNGPQPVEYTVLSSAVPGVFNLGGDLALFTRLIEARDRDALVAYGRACVDVLYRNYIGHGLHAMTISLVQGECLGGGFEAALSSDIIVAERQARFGFPEMLFNLFPGMGAYSFLDRKIGSRAAEQLIASGRLYSAEEMRSMGVVDVVVDPGQGEAGVEALIKRQGRNHNGLTGMNAVRRRVHSITVAELMDVVRIWADTALRLTTRDLKLMQRLAARQTERAAGEQVH